MPPFTNDWCSKTNEGQNRPALPREDADASIQTMLHVKLRTNG